MFDLATAISAIEDVITKLQNNSQVAGTQKGVVTVDVLTLFNMQYQLEEVFAFLQSNSSMVEIIYRERYPNTDIWPIVGESLKKIVIDLNKFWEGICPICQAKFGIELSCPRCGFPTRAGMDRDIEKIKHWAYHYSHQRKNHVELFAEPVLVFIA